MAQLRTHKFVASLPAQLEADAIYYVRTGAGFDQYVTNHSGTIVAYPLNQSGGSGGAPLDSPAFTGVPTAPTAAAGANSTQLATTAFIATALSSYALNSSLSSYAPLASPALTGTPTAPTQTAGNNTTRIATTAFVTTAISSKANLASPTFTGTPAAPTATQGTNTTQLATTAFVTTGLNLKANLASPTFTGTPAAPTAAPGTNTTQLATTAFVQQAITGLSGGSQIKGLGAFCSGKPSADQVIAGWVVPYAMTLSAGNSDASSLVSATTSTVFTIKKNNTSIGSITFSANGTVGVYNLTATGVLVNDLITIHAPSSADSTLANIAITLVE